MRRAEGIVESDEAGGGGGPPASASASSAKPPPPPDRDDGGVLPTSSVRLDSASRSSETSILRSWSSSIVVVPPFERSDDDDDEGSARRGGGGGGEALLLRPPKSEIGSLDFEHVVNRYSIRATREQRTLPPSSSPPSESDGGDEFGGGVGRIRRRRRRRDDDGSGVTALLAAGGGGGSTEDSYGAVVGEEESDDGDGGGGAVLGGRTPPGRRPTARPRSRRRRRSDGGRRRRVGGAFRLLRPKKLAGYTGRTATRWVLVCLTGLLTGCVAVLIVWSTERLVEYRLRRLDLTKEERSFVKNDDVEGEKFGSPAWPIREGDVLRRYLVVFLKYACYNLFLALSSSAMCLMFAPEAVGSGIPEMKAYLNGVRVKRFTNAKLFLVKIFGTVLSVSSGLTIGPEGPLVHLGSIVGASLTKTRKLEERVRRFRRDRPCLSDVLGCGAPGSGGGAPKNRRDADGGVQDDVDDGGDMELQDLTDVRKEDGFRRCFQPNTVLSSLALDLAHFQKDTERRDLISVGAAAGFAAAFGAPIGGLLFSLEEASSFFANQLLWKTLTATAIATFCLAAYRGDLSDYSVISLGTIQTPDDRVLINRFAEVPLYALVGAVGGFLGALFNETSKLMNTKRMAFFTREVLSSRSKTAWKLAEVALLSVLTSFFMFTFPLTMDWSCEASTEVDKYPLTKESLETDVLTTNEHRFNCDLGQINELGTIFFGSREEAIKDILTDPSGFDPRTLLTVGLLFFPLMTLTYGVSLPSGIFMPTILTGASLGGYAGILLQNHVASNIAPSTFALLGAAALLAGIQRSTVSLCVILVEGTGLVKVLIPVIVTVVVARYIGDLFNEGIYEIGMELKKYPFLHHQVKKIYEVIKVSDIMSFPVRTLPCVETAGNIESLLLSSSHHGFPVVDPATNKFLGLVRRDQLVALLECGVYMESDSGTKSISSHRRKGSIHESPLMNLAYHIKDDRYGSMRSDTAYVNSLEDDFDEHAWLLDTVKVGDETVSFAGDDGLPTGTMKRNHKTIVTTENGKLVVFLPDEDRAKHIDVSAVMNQGAFCVTEGLPVSKAHLMFTALGLRHLVVLGGKGGGEVVGVITRCNLDEQFIEQKIGCAL